MVSDCECESSTAVSFIEDGFYCQNCETERPYMENNYLTEIEAEYSRFREIPSRLSPKDWHLAQTWEDDGIPIRIVIRAMEEVKKKFDSEKRPDKINSLSYFSQTVEKEFADWSKHQVGKSESNNLPIAEDDGIGNLSKEIEMLGEFHSEYFNKSKDNNFKEPLKSTVQEVTNKLNKILFNAKHNESTFFEIEDALSNERAKIELSMAESLSDKERKEMVKSIHQEIGDKEIFSIAKYNLANKKLYSKFDLPELTLFAL